MALDFSTGSVYVDHGSAAGLDNLDPVTFVMIHRPTTLAAGFQMAFAKGANTFCTISNEAPQGGAGSVRMRVVYSGGDYDYHTAGSEVAVDTEYFTAWIFDTSRAAGDQIVIYNNELGSPLTEATLSTNTDGSGSRTSDAGANLLAGAFDTSGTFLMDGDGAVWAVFDSALTENQLRTLLESPISRWADFNPVVLALADETGTLYDYSGSGNDGTVGAGVLATGMRHPPFFLGNPKTIFESAAAGITGTIDITMPAATITATGTNVDPVFTGTVDVTAPAITISCTATNDSNPTATIDVTAPAITISSTATNDSNPSADIDVTAPAITISCTATNDSNPDATIDVTAPAITISCTGTNVDPSFTGTVDITMPAMTITDMTAVFTEGLVGSIDLTFPMMTISSTATHVPNPVGTIDVTMPAMTISSTATNVDPGISGDIAITMPAITMSATGTNNSNPSADIDVTSPVVQISSTGTFTGPQQATTTYNSSGVATFQFTVPAGALSGDEYTFSLDDEDTLSDVITLTVP